MHRNLNVIFLFLFSVVAINAESIRGPLTENFTLNTSQTEQDFTLSFEDLAAFSLENRDFFRGFEIKIEVPQKVKRFRDGIAVFIYSNISPVPSSSLKAYSGERLFVRNLPISSTFYVRIPLIQEHNFSSSLSTFLPTKTLKEGDFPLILTILPVMKGLPRNIADTSFPLSVKPIFLEKGKLNISLSSTVEEDKINKEELAFFIDKTEKKYTEKGYILQTGMHSLTIESNKYKTKNLSFEIRKAATTELSIELEPYESTVLLDIPETTDTFLDGKELSVIAGRKRPIEPGEHTILFQIGDYQLSKQFTVEKGKDYTISISFDIFIEEH